MSTQRPVILKEAFHDFSEFFFTCILSYSTAVAFHIHCSLLFNDYLIIIQRHVAWVIESVFKLTTTKQNVVTELAAVHVKAYFTMSRQFSGPFAKVREGTYYLHNACQSVFSYFCPSVRMKQLGSHWTDFHEIWCFSIFRKSVEKVQVALKSDNYNGWFTWRPIYIYDLSRSVLPRIKSKRIPSIFNDESTESFICHGDTYTCHT
jgi:hypothetical protein